MEKLRTKATEKILHRENDFCCLCFKTFEDDRTGLDDEVVLLEYEVERAQKVSEIIAYVLGISVLADITTFEAICLKCTTDIANCYKFQKQIRDNLKFINNSVDNLMMSLEYSPDNEDLFNSLFILADSDAVVHAQYYHYNSSPIYNKSQVLETYKSIMGTKIEKEQMEDKNKYLNVQNIKDTTESSNRLKIRSEDEGKYVKCEECFKEFSSTVKLRHHVLRVHEPKKFKCPECSKCYSTGSLLKQHLAHSHISLVCAECGKTFNNISSWRTHEKSHYKRYVCQSCGRVYKNQSTYKRHFDNNICQMRTRHSPADAKFTCDYCGKKYTQKITLRVHIQYEHGDKKYIECEWCNKKFWCQARLKAHIVKHTKEKNFQCTICNGKFVTKESLIYHTRIHTGEKPYQCTFCDSRFLSASRKQAHIKSHHMNITVECDICHNKFKSAYYLAKHKKIHERADKIQKGFVQIRPKNVDKTREALANVKVNVKDENEALGFLEDGDNVQQNAVTYHIKENNLHANLQFQRLVYNAVVEDNICELPINNDNGNNSQVEFLILGRNNQEWPPKTSSGK